MKNMGAAVASLLTALCLAGCGSAGVSGVNSPAASATSAAVPTTATPAPVTVATTPASVAVPSVTAPAATPVYAPPPAAAHTPPAPANTPLPAAPPGDGTYANVDGNTVPDPVSAAAPPAGATAQCNDGTYSFSQHHSGTCSSHGGVSRWL